MLADALLGIQRLEGGVLGLIARFASGVIERLIYEQITAPLAQAAGMLLQSGLSSLLGFFGGPNPSAHSIPGPPIIPVTATPLHTGGIVGREGGAPRAVPELLFSAAPRLHSGGYIRPGEVPAILKRGEGVFTPEQMAALGGGDTTVIINDMRSASAPPVEVRDRRGPDGRRIVETFVRDAVNRGLADGSFDRAMQMSYGISRAGMR